jgi:Uma2 family endonuclease
MNDVAAAPLPGTQIDPRYPDSDGRPMGDTDYHNVALIWLREGLEDHFADVSDVYVASNLILYYQEGDPSARRDPDGLVAKGVGKHRRRSFRVWEEKKMPCTLFEVASRKTWRVDLGEKRQLYARLKVKEYFVFDPEGRYLDPPLQGFKSVKGKSVPMKPAADGSLVSKELGLRLVPEGEMLRLIDLKTGQPILTRSERAEQEKQRAEEEKQRAEQEKRRTRQEKQRAEQEKQRAEQEKQRAEDLAAEVERLRALLKSRRDTHT